MGKNKLDELIAAVFDGDDGPIRTVSEWYRDLDATAAEVRPLAKLSNGKSVCPGSPKTCLWAGWCPGFERICDSCPYRLQCFPLSGGLPLTEPAILADVRSASFSKLDNE